MFRRLTDIDASIESSRLQMACNVIRLVWDRCISIQFLLDLVFWSTLTSLPRGTHYLVARSSECDFIEWSGFKRGLISQRNFTVFEYMVSIILYGRLTLTSPEAVAMIVRMVIRKRLSFMFSRRQERTMQGSCLSSSGCRPFGKIILPSIRRTKLMSDETREDAITFITGVAFGSKMNH